MTNTFTQPGWQIQGGVTNVGTLNLNVNPNDLQVAAALIQAAQRQPGSGSHDASLYRALLSLNYQAQFRSFLKSISSRTLAAFLIDGLEMYGQRWLLNRLMKRFDEAIQGVPIDLRRLGRGKSIGDLCREISAKAGVQADTPEQIAEILCSWWRTQHTIIILHSVERIGEPFLNDILQNFWWPIVAVAQQSACRNGKYKLFMFLVDNRGDVSNWNVAFAQETDQGWQPDLPIKLPTISRLSYDDLDSWINNSLIDLPDDFAARTDAQAILDNTFDGVPESVLKEICALCDYDWEKGAAQWLKY